ncbi:hypothetical protein SKA58_16388 [Sphingomonas sp. SKA58]|nr:hypothetical protein SKA58_16388 [Sphingomonas sp. SKA58]|tara:strand:+ start:4270 stop:4380 length:111 start_codon:yes stop_codon:yes gene_type:complete
MRRKVLGISQQAFAYDIEIEGLYFRIVECVTAKEGL